MRVRRQVGRPEAQDGFTIVEVVMAVAVLAMVIGPLAGAFWASIRTAGVSAHRSDAAAVASREIEGIRATPYAQVGFYTDQPGYVASFEGLTTVNLGPNAPTSGALVPQFDPQSSGIVQGGVTYSVTRYVLWTDAADASSTYTQAYKRLTVIVTWKDQVGTHTVRQDSILYPGGQGKFTGAMGGSTSTTTTTTALNPMAPVLNAVVGLPDPAGETQVPLTWSQPAGGATVTSYTVEYSTNPSFPVGNFSVIANLPASTTSFTVSSLSSNTNYYFKVIALAGANSATSNRASFATLPPAAPTCVLGQLNITGAESLSSTGTILAANGSGKMSENLTLAWTTSGTCPDTYNVRAVDPTNTADPGSPYALLANSGTYSATVNSNGANGWAIGLHTFTVWDSSTNSATTVVKTFTVCAKGSSSC